MADIDFRHFDPRTFEQFVQALGSKVLGEGLLIFGDGPDGGREASFDGSVPYPSKTDRWNGYIVVQAKFRQKLSGAADDANWLIGQLKAEFAKFQGNPNLRIPEFYILATNVSLSGITGGKRGKGGQEKVDEWFAKEGKALGVKQLQVWHPIVIQTLLEDAPHLRQKYIGWLTPHDVLAEAFKFFQAKSPDFKATMTLYLQRELRSQRATRLQQAGHLTDSPTFLESVFFDLPFLNLGDPTSDLPWLQTVEDEEGTESELLLASLLRRATAKLDPLTLRDTQASSVNRGLHRPDRHLILGGPGQGKSTISQFFGQVMRARLLNSERELPLPPDIEEIVEAIRERLKHDGLPFDGPRRFPLRIDLPGLSDAIANAREGGTQITLVGHIATQIGLVTETPVEVADVRGWLAAYPWLLLLDGLDEVPPSSNRAEVIRAVVEFWDDAFAASADVLMVVTTRPQGYNDDLDPKLYGKLEMARLEPGQALGYAEKLAAHKLSDPEHRSRVMTRLQEASENPTTALLLVSPLQVAILFALIDQRGQSPRDRWTLFHEYFGVVMKREQEKPGAAGEVMKSRARPIAHILQKAGFILHVDAEDVGGAEAYLTPAEFRTLIQSQLAEDGFEAAALEHGVEEIAFAATNRLVFLEQREEGKLAFDVRSLQEYMAAAHIMASSETRVQARLRAIAARSHWQHVFKISASKCFSAPDTEQFRDTIVTICQELDVGADAEDRTARTGALLALSLLADGLAFDQPRYQRLLLSRSLELLRIGPEAVTSELVHASLAETDLVATAIRSALSEGSVRWRHGAWQLLLELNGRNVEWAAQAVNEYWPVGVEQQLEIAFNAINAPFVGAAGEKADALLMSVGPDVVVKALGKFDFDQCRQVEGAHGKRHPWLSLFCGGRQGKISFPVLPKANTALTITAVSLTDDREDSALFAVPRTDEWAHFTAIVDFSREPSRSTLAEALRAGATPRRFTLIRSMLEQLPWPFANVHIVARTFADLLGLADRAAAGEFGGSHDWLDAEQRLRGGVEEADLEKWIEGVFLPLDIATGRGVPGAGTSLSLTMGSVDSPRWLDPLIALSRRCKSPIGQSAFARLINFPLESYDTSLRLGLDDAERLIFSRHIDGREWTFLSGYLGAFPSEIIDSAQFLDKLEDRAQRGRVASWNDRPDRSNMATELALRHPSRSALLVVALRVALGGKELELTANALRHLAERGLSSEFPIVRTAAAALLLAAGRDVDDALLDELRGIEDIRDGVRSVIVVARKDLLPAALMIRVLTTLLDDSQTLHPTDRSELRTELQRILDQRKSLLTGQSCWQDLGFAPELFDALRARATRRSDAARAGTE